jgi:hypothetical protein
MAVCCSLKTPAAVIATIRKVATISTGRPACSTAASATVTRPLSGVSARNGSRSSSLTCGAVTYRPASVNMRWRLSYHRCRGGPHCAEPRSSGCDASVSIGKRASDAVIAVYGCSRMSREYLLPRALRPVWSSHHEISQIAQTVVLWRLKPTPVSHR